MKNKALNDYHCSLTGEVSGATYTTKESNIMRVIWQPDGGVNVRGLMVRH